MECIRRGYAEVGNPFNPKQISRVDLTPANVDCIVFWSKNPSPLFPSLPELDRLGYRYYFQFTLTPYDRMIEPGLPEKEKLTADFIRLSERIGRERVIWRYDPLLFSGAFGTEYHLSRFNVLAEKLAPYTERCIFSFVDFYPKVSAALSRSGFFDPEESVKLAIAAGFKKTADSLGLLLNACAEKMDFRPLGIEPSCCIDKDLIERITGRILKFRKDRNQRPECGCVESRDIGMYHTCRHACLYCYAK